MKYKISVIIPCYNAEGLIETCIRSVVNQTIRPIEIVCVDDGSSDGTYLKLLELKNKYISENLSFTIMQQKNCGSGVARNAGMKNAFGEFISFLDVDDIYYDPVALECMYNASKITECNICGAQMQMLSDRGINDYNLYKPIVDFERMNVIDFSLYQNGYYYQSYIYRRVFLQDNNLVFPNYRRYQDPPFFVKAVSIEKKMCVVPNILYQYTVADDKLDITKKNIVDILNGIHDVLIIAKNNDYRKLFEFTINSIENYFYEAVVSTLSNTTLKLLLQINEITEEYIGKTISILYEFYNNSRRAGNNISLSHSILEKYLAIKQTDGVFANYFHKKNINKVIVYGVGAYGKRLINELQAIGVDIIYAIDKNVLYYENVLIKKPDELILECDAIIVSVLDSDDIIKKLEERTYIPIYSFKNIIEECFQIAEKKKKYKIKNYLEYLIVNILDHCNLKCKGCDHFACIADPYFVPLKTVQKDIRRMAELFGGKDIMQIAVMGGEPLLHPDLLEILIEVRKNFPLSIIRLTTNGILLLSQGDDFWKVCRELKITIVNTRYPLKTDYDAIELKAKEEKVDFRYFEGTGEGYIKKSFKKHINLSCDSNIEEVFEECHISNYGNFLMEGKLYGCPFSCQSNRIFAKKYGKNMILESDDYIDIYNINSTNDIYKFVAKPRHYCGYCKGITEQFNWERSNQLIEEWI